VDPYHARLVWQNHRLEVFAEGDCANMQALARQVLIWSSQSAVQMITHSPHRSSTFSFSEDEIGIRACPLVQVRLSACSASDYQLPCGHIPAREAVPSNLLCRYVGAVRSCDETDTREITYVADNSVETLKYEARHGRNRSERSVCC